MEDKRIKRQNIYKIIMLVILTATITFMLTTMIMYNKFVTSYGSIGIKTNTDGTSSISTTDLVKTLETFKTMIKQKYIGEVDEEKMVEGAIKGFVEGLGDPYTEYLPKEEMTEFTEETSSQYVGIGIYLTNDKTTNTILVVGTMNGSPALEAGMQAGDIIEKVNDVAYTGETMDDAIKVLKGEEGTSAKVTVLRDGKEIDLTVTRKKITVEHVSSKTVENNIAYLQVDSFDSGVAESFKKQVTELVNKGAKGIIIDLRSNGGGIVSEATGIADLFLKKDETILITKSKIANEQLTVSKNDAIITDIPVVILVNEGTASASEIFVGAMKDNGAAKIVGTKTYGKGVMQELAPLKSGGALKVTIEEFKTPNGDTINKKGIEPDVEVEDDEKTDKDEQLQKAIEILK